MPGIATQTRFSFSLSAARMAAAPLSPESQAEQGLSRRVSVESEPRRSLPGRMMASLGGGLKNCRDLVSRSCARIAPHLSAGLTPGFLGILAQQPPALMIGALIGFAVGAAGGPVGAFGGAALGVVVGTVVGGLAFFTAGVYRSMRAEQRAAEAQAQAAAAVPGPEEAAEDSPTESCDALRPESPE